MHWITKSTLALFIGCALGGCNGTLRSSPPVPVSVETYAVGQTFETRGSTRLVDYPNQPGRGGSRIGFVVGSIPNRLVTSVDRSFRLTVVSSEVKWVFSMGGWYHDVTLVALDGPFVGREFSPPWGKLTKTPEGVLYRRQNTEILKRVR
jgi:hypothetical protein